MAPVRLPRNSSLRVSLLMVSLALLALPFSARAQLKIVATQLAGGLNRPLYVTSAPGDKNHLYVVEQHTGVIRVMNRHTGQLQTTPFLDLSGLSTGNEQGLLGLAFAPDYATTGHFFVNYTNSSGTTRVERYTRSEDPLVADPGSVTRVLSISQPQGNHNGGWMGFGPDGFLYIATGDGGGGDDNDAGHTPNVGNGQDITDNLLGKMLRLDVAGAELPDDFPADAGRNYAVPNSNPFVGQDGDDEIWAYGLRNPWRSSFDRATGDFYIGDVGQNQWEEINFQPAGSAGGENYGWRLREGLVATPSGGVGGPLPPGAVDPIHVYRHEGGPNGGFSVTGGYVYRGSLPDLQGHYFFSDYVSDQIWSFRYDGASVQDFANRTSSFVTDTGQAIESVASFGEDNDGNLYIVSLSGNVFRVDAGFQAEPILPAGSPWKYLDDGSDQATAWRAAGFDDSGWQQGPAQLGYGDGDEQTVVSFGGSSSNKHVTTYFRRTFQVEDNAQIATLVLDLVRDDGAAVYLNGTEVVRTENLAPDAAFDTLANFNGAPAVSGAEESRFFSFLIDPELLLEGDNLLAVEIHQDSRTSSDISFDLALFADLLPSIGDFDRDGQLGSGDIDVLADAFAAGEMSNIYDVNDDGALTRDDLEYWASELAGVLPGDANLDGVVNEADLQMLLPNLFSETDRWTAGDFNFDGHADGRDFNLWNANRGLSAASGNEVVPEPSTAMLLCIAVAVGAAVHRRPRTLHPSNRLRRRGQLASG